MNEALATKEVRERSALLWATLKPGSCVTALETGHWRTRTSGVVETKFGDHCIIEDIEIPPLGSSGLATMIHMNGSRFIIYVEFLANFIAHYFKSMDDD